MECLLYIILMVASYTFGAMVGDWLFDLIFKRKKRENANEKT